MLGPPAGNPYMRRCSQDNVEAKIAYGAWLAAEADRYSALILAAEPRDTLTAHFSVALESRSWPR